MPEEGVVYVATGDQHLEEAIFSARSLREQMPDTHITLFTDGIETHEIFDNVVEVEDPNYDYRDKILPLKETPYERTLFLDTDTYVCRPVNELFPLLDRYDIAAAHSNMRRRKFVEIEGVPRSFSEFNTGVILFGEVPEIDEVLDRWMEYHEKYTDLHHDKIVDEPAFCEAVYKSDLSVGVLPPEYNCRFASTGFLHGEAKILHAVNARGFDMERMAEALNRETDKRVHTGKSHRRIYAEPKPVKVIKYPGPGRWRGHLGSLTRSIREDGLKETARTVVKRTKRVF